VSGGVAEATAGDGPEVEPGSVNDSPALRFAHELLLASSPGEIAALLAQRVSESLGGPAAMYLAGPDTEPTLGYVFPEGTRFGGALPLVEQALASGSIAIAPVDRALDANGLADPARRAAVPITTASGPFGVIVIDGVDEARDIRFLMTIADLVSAAVTHREHAQASAEEARLDPLTGLANKRAFHEQLGEAVQKAEEDGGPLSIIIFDLDDFKKINDREGHLVGDRVLHEVARVTLATLRVGEDAFRLGGEEFAVLLEARKEGAEQVADRIRQGLAAQRRGEHLPSISAGVATFPEDGRSKHELLHKADVALYAAKERGKDRVVGYSSRIADDTTSIEVERQHRLEGEWWRKVLGAASRGTWADDKAGPGWSPDDVSQLAVFVGREMGLPEEELDAVSLGAVLVELSKLGIPEAIKAKSGRLSPREANLVRERTSQIVSALTPVPHLSGALPILRSCRERWDGNGYPDGLAGDAIPVGARVVAVCDTFCALVRQRSYRPARTQARALLELQERAGSWFDPAVVHALHTIMERPARSR
jgi:diguanylate cyclase (GGDEF)-like protein